MTVALEEFAQAPLRNARKITHAKSIRQHVGRLVAQNVRGLAIGSNPAGQSPQLEIHLRRDVVRQAAQNGLQVVGRGIVAENPGRDRAKIAALPPTSANLPALIAAMSTTSVVFQSIGVIATSHAAFFAHYRAASA